MKKIININFHSRVIPIEETAYDILRRYIESLKKHFSGEEGGDEIVNDIENRFAELFSDRLKKGATCITDADVEEIIANMGRPEDFDQDEKTNAPGDSGFTSFSQESTADEPRRLYRSENDKMLGGVCGGLAAYLKIDPSIVRIFYAVLTLVSFGSALLLYIILWAVLPTRSMVTTIKKRLFRDPDHRVIGGVASGLAAYFNIEVWIPRVIFCLPLIAGAITSIFRHAWFYEGPAFFANGFGGTLFITYIILWIVLPEARTASEKLEMRGEKVDLESIKNTIKSDLHGFRQKATVVGSEMKQKASDFSSEMRNRSGHIRREVSSVPRQGIGHAIGVLFRAFFLFISVVITFSLVMALIGLIFTGAGIYNFKFYLINGFWQNILAWSVLLFFLILPVVGLLTWLIRRIIGVRSRSHYLGYTFGSLWVIGLISLIILAASFSRSFSMRSGVKEEVPMSAPAHGKLIVKMDDTKPIFFDSEWMGINWRHDAPFFEVTEDSLMMNTVRIDLVKSNDTAWHMQVNKLSRGNNSREAQRLASQINFSVEQKDSVLLLGRGFSITPSQQFRNQQVLIVIQVPVGKKIYMNENLEAYRWFNITRKWRNNNIDIESDDDGDYKSGSWDSETEYIMTENGLQRTTAVSGGNDEAPERAEKPERKEQPEKKEAPERKENSDSNQSNPNGDYRYHKKKQVGATTSTRQDAAQNGDLETSAALVLLTSLS
jgi:phage shock protein PspC (stress-responsive transcriptional regulator)